MVVAKVVAVSFSLIASGGILALSLFDIPELRAQPASRSLPAIRWLFSRGSHIFPQAALISSVSFATLAYHAYQALPAASSGQDYPAFPARNLPWLGCPRLCAG